MSEINFLNHRVVTQYFFSLSNSIRNKERFCALAIYGVQKFKWRVDKRSWSSLGSQVSQLLFGKHLLACTCATLSFQLHLCIFQPASNRKSKLQSTYIDSRYTCILLRGSQLRRKKIQLLISRSNFLKASSRKLVLRIIDRGIKN